MGGKGAQFLYCSSIFPGCERGVCGQPICLRAAHLPAGRGPPAASSSGSLAPPARKGLLRAPPDLAVGFEENLTRGGAGFWCLGGLCVVM